MASSPIHLPLVRAVEPLGLFLILRAFSSGCSAMTGIEAIANGVTLFREPAATRARTTMLVMGLMLAAMFFCVSGLGYLYGVAPDPERTVMAQIGLRVFGAGSPLLWALQITTLLILVLAANTAFAGFPRLAAMLAQDRFLPRQMGWLGDRLVFQNGITTLVLATALIILVCRGDTTVAVNLYALGVFMAFTLSQTGMVVLWWRQRGPGWHGRLLMNALGAATTCVVLVVIVLSKFAEGAWTVVIAIPLLVALLARIRRRYRRVYAEIAVQPDQVQPVRLPQRHEPIGNRSIVWIASFSRPSLDALHYAARVSDQVLAVWVLSDNEDPAAIEADWLRLVGDDPQVELRLVDSPFASLIQPFVAVVEAEENRYPDLHAHDRDAGGDPPLPLRQPAAQPARDQHAPGSRCPAQPGLHHGALLLAGLIPDRRLQPLTPHSAVSSLGDPADRVLSSYGFELPPERIAQRPVEPRHAARLLAVQADAGCRHRTVWDLQEELQPRRSAGGERHPGAAGAAAGPPGRSGGAVELLVLEPRGEARWLCLARPAKRLRPGDQLELEAEGQPPLTVEVLDSDPETGGRIVHFPPDAADAAGLEPLLLAYGAMPLPPYIQEHDASDNERYQTRLRRAARCRGGPHGGSAPQ